MSQEELAQAYARLKSMKDNLAKTHEVDRKYIVEYHRILDQLEAATGSKLHDFRVPDTEIHPQISGGNYITGEVHYSGRQVCERSYLAMKVDAVLGFFTIKTASRPKEFGFKP